MTLQFPKGYQIFKAGDSGE